MPLALLPFHTTENQSLPFKKCRRASCVVRDHNLIDGRREEVKVASRCAGDGAHLVGGGRDLRRQLLTQLKLLGDNPQIKRRLTNNSIFESI